MIKLEKSRKKRISNVNYVTILLTVVLIITFMYMLSTFGNLNVYGDGETEFIYVTIEAGDTVWSLAKENTPSNRDLRETISLINKYNDINESLLFVGDVIKIPKLYKWNKALGPFFIFKYLQW